jgi:hypothetical protein
MEKLLKNYKPIKGDHCSSTCLTEIARYNGMEVDEPLIFGIASGLDFIYVKHSEFKFSRIISGRTPMLESNLFKNMGKSLYWREGKDIKWSEIKEYIDNGIPLLFLTDIYYLPFYNTSRNNFTGHTISVIGYDENRQILFVSDYISDKILELSYKDLIKSIKDVKPPFYKRFQMMPVTVSNMDFKECSIKELVINGLYSNAKSMLDESKYRGVNAISKFAIECEYFYDLPNWENLCMQMYQSLERIGTGGSGFRKIYREFLIQANVLLKNQLEKPLLIITEIEKLYKLLSKKLYLVSRKSDLKYLKEIKNIAKSIEAREKHLWECILETVFKRGKLYVGS